MKNINYIEDEKLNNILQKCISKILKKEIKPCCKGSYSYCYECGNFVVLRSINKVSNNEEQNSNFKNLQKTIETLKSKHKVNTPRLFAEFFINNQRFVIQERIRGLNLSIYYPHTAKALAYNNCVCDESDSKKDLENEKEILTNEVKIIGDFLFKYNNSILKQLIEAKQCIFDDYVRDFVKLTKSGVQIDYFRSENFIFNKENGITFIDLSVNKNPKQDYKIDIKDILMPFKDFLNFKIYMNEKQIKVLENNLKVVYKKVFKAIYNNNLITKDELAKIRGKQENGFNA